MIEAIRQEAAVRFGLAPDTATAALRRGTPKVAVLSTSSPSLRDNEQPQNIPSAFVQSYSIGKPHPSFQLTGAVCLGTALCIPQTVPYCLVHTNTILTPPRSPSSMTGDHNKMLEISSALHTVKIRHGSGEMDVTVKLVDTDLETVTVESVTVSRTASRLFKGEVYFTK